MDKIEQLYNLYLSKNIITSKTSLEKFRAANQEQQNKLYELGKNKNLFQTTDFNKFQTAWGGSMSEEPVKKKVPSSSVGQNQGTMGSTGQPKQAKNTSSVSSLGLTDDVVSKLNNLKSTPVKKYSSQEQVVEEFNPERAQANEMLAQAKAEKITEPQKQAMEKAFIGTGYGLNESEQQEYNKLYDEAVKKGTITQEGALQVDLEKLKEQSILLSVDKNAAAEAEAEDKKAADLRNISLDSYRKLKYSKVAEMFLSDEDKAEYDLQKNLNHWETEMFATSTNGTPNELMLKKYKEAKLNLDNYKEGMVTRSQDAIKIINEKLLEDPNNKELREELIKERARTQAFINPVAAGKALYSKSADIQKAPGRNPLEKMENRYNGLIKQVADLKLTMTEGALSMIPLVGDVTGIDDKVRRVSELMKQIEELTPIVLLNKKSLKEDNFFTQFGKSLVSGLSAASPLTTEQEQSSIIFDALNATGTTGDVSEDNLKGLEESFRQTTGELIGSTGGSTLSIMPAMVSGGYAISSLKNMSRLGKAIDKLSDSNKVAKLFFGATETGLAYEASSLFGDSVSTEEESSFVSGALGEVFSQGLSAIAKRNIYMQAMIKAFGSNASKAQKYMAIAAQRSGAGFGEVAEEYGNEFGSIIEDSDGSLEKFTNLVKERFGTLNQNLEFGALTFGMGVVFGSFTNAGKQFAESHKQWLSNQSDEIKQQFEEISLELNTGVDEALNEISSPDAAEAKPTPNKVTVLGKEVNMYNEYIPSKTEDIESDAMYSFSADSKEGIPPLLQDVAYSNTTELNGVKTEKWNASISGDELLKLYPATATEQATPQATVAEDVVYGLTKDEAAELEDLEDFLDKREADNDYINSKASSVPKAIVNSFINPKYVYKVFAEAFTVKKANEKFSRYVELYDKRQEAIGLPERYFDDEGNFIAPVVIEEESTPKATEKVDALSDVESTAKALEGLPREPQDKIYPNKVMEIEGVPLSPLSFDENALSWESNNPQSVAEAYHRAKQENSNPGLVNAVEKLLGKPLPQATEKVEVEGEVKIKASERVVYDREPTTDDGVYKILGDENNIIYRVNSNTGRIQEYADGLWSNAASNAIARGTARKQGFQKIKDPSKSEQPTKPTPQATEKVVGEETPNEIVYEMNKTDKKIWSKDFEIIDNRNGEEDAEGAKWMVRNVVTGYMIDAKSKKDAQYIIDNAPAEAELFGEGEKVEIDTEPEKVADVETQVQDFGVGEDDVKPVVSVISKIFNTLKSAGLTASKTVSDWVGIGKGTEKPYTLKINGKDVEVKNINEDVVNGFYSQLARAISSSKQDKMPAKQWIDKFANNEEARWTGLKDWLSNQQGSVSKSDIQQYLKDNRIEIVEVTKTYFDEKKVEENLDALYKKRKGLEAKFLEPLSNKVRDFVEKYNNLTKEMVSVDMNMDDWIEQASKISEKRKELLDKFDAKEYIDIDKGIASRKKDNWIYVIGKPFYENNPEYIKEAKELDSQIGILEEEYEAGSGSQPKFSRYQLEGEKENYKEVLVTLPSKNPLQQRVLELEKIYEQDGSNYNRSELEEAKKELVESKTTSFRSSHFDEPNILVHLRMNTRTDADGNKVLFLEEVQSDWGQIGKKEGFKRDINESEKKQINAIKEKQQTILDGLKSYKLFKKLTEGRLDEMSKGHEDDKVHTLVTVLQQEVFSVINNPYYDKNDIKDVERGVERISKSLHSLMKYWFRESNGLDLSMEDRINLINALKEDAKSGVGESYGRYELSVFKDFQDLQNKKHTIEFEATKGRTPSAPFVMDTNDWAKLGLKVALKEAVNQGATKIAWTTGEQQNDRYDLSKIADEVRYSKNEDGTYKIVAYKNGENISENKSLNEKDLESNFGKEVSKRIIDGEGENIEGEKSLTGENLRVGGKGMKGFYGSPAEGSLGIVGGVAKKLFKQVPKTVILGKVKTLGERAVIEENRKGLFNIYDREASPIPLFKDIATREEAESILKEPIKNKSTQYSIDITPELKAQVEEGQQLFKDAEAQYRIENGKNLIEAIKSFDGSAKAVVAITHEIMHPTVVAIIDGARDKNKVGLKHTKTIIDEFNKANPKNKVNLAELIAGNDSFKAGDTTAKYRAVQEFIAESFERYNTEGAKGFSKSFQEVLDQIKKAFQEVYTTITGKDLSPELRSMFDEILGKNQSTLKDAKEPGTRIITKAREILFKGMQPKIKDGKNFSAHEIKEGEFAALDIKLAMDYKGLLPLKQFSIPAGTTVDVVKLAPEDSKEGMLAARKIETDAIDASDAQVVKLLTYDSRGGVSEQYIIKDKSILDSSKDVTDSQLKSRLASLKGKIPTEIKRIFDKVKNIKEITYIEQQAIVDQIISDQADMAQISESIMQELVELEGKGKISQKQSNAIVSRMSKLDKLNEAKVARFIDYASKILNDANYKFKVDAVAAKLKKAKLNIPRRLGINKAGGIVKRLFTMDMSLVPKEVFDKYAELVELMASSSSIIEINKDIDEIARIAQEVLSVVEVQNGKLQTLAEVYQENKSDKLTYTQNLDKMLVDGIININDKEIMSKYKSLIDKKPAVKKTKAEIEEEKKELIKGILSERKLETREFATRAETDLAIQTKKLATKENMDLLSVAQLKKLSKVISNINNGLVDRNTFMLRNRLNANNSIQPVYDATLKAKINFITNYFHLLKPKAKSARFGAEGMSPTTSAIRFGLGFNIDTELGNPKTRELWENLLERLAIGENLDDTKVNSIVTQLDKATDKIYKSFFRRENRLVESKAKMFLYKIGLEFKSNPDSDQVKSPEAYLKKTINDGKLDKRTKKMLSDILNDKNLFVDGVLDLDKLYNSFNKYEKEFIELAGKINQEASEYAMFDAGIIQDKPITLLNDYVHHIVIKDEVTVSNDTAADMADKISRSMTPSTRAKHLTDREDVVTPLNFDLYNSLVTGIKKTYLTYYMTEPIMTSRLVLDGLKAKMIKDGTFEDNKDIFQALNEKVEEGINNLLFYNIASNTEIDEIANEIGNEAYRYILASDQKLFAETAGAISYIAINKLNTFADGVKAMNKITMEEFAAIATNAKTIHLTKFLPKNVLYASRLVESSSSKSGTASKKTKSKAGDYAKLFYNQTFKRARNVAGAINDFTITTADKLMNLPLWYGSFRSEFKKVSGEELDKNKFVANDLEYVQKYENAIEVARRYADEVITDATSVKGKFSGKLTGKDFDRVKTSGVVKFVTYFNEFMAGFMQGETNALIKGVRASRGSGRKGMSRADGRRLVAAVLARSISYNVVIATTAGGLFYAIYKALNDLEDDKYEKELSKETLAEGTKKAAIAAVSGRVGNVFKIPINLAGDYVNREYFYDGPEEEYEILTYLPKPDKMGWETTSLYDYIPALSGKYGVGLKTANEGFKIYQEEDKLNKKETSGMKYSKLMELESKKNNMPYKKLALGVSILGQMGYIPFGKNVAKIAKKEAYRDKE